MCGIAAIFGHSADAPPVDQDELIAIRDRMLHRGPDGDGLWISPDRRIGLGHRRLSIIDLSDAGAQPMWNGERTLCITYNGEIYNYAALRAGLLAKGYRFQSDCDTEVLLHLYAEKGAAMMNQLRGMYAFAIWDARNRTLFCARDPFGIKPLYYADNGRTIRVASQVKALLAGGGIRSTPDPAGHVGFFLWGAVPDPFTQHREIAGLPAGHTLTITAGGTPELHSFCSVPGILRDAEEAAREMPALSAGQQQELLHAALRDSAEHHLIADVPVGVFLSAGLDSSTITALVSEAHQDVRTVTLGFDEYRGTDQDETVLAEVVARQYRTNHRTISINRRDFEHAAANLFESMDRPSIDGVNTYFVSLAARRAGLKVALSGVGGDELFGGYPSFTDLPRIVRMANRWPGLTQLGRQFRVVTSRLVKRLTSPKYAGIFEYGADYPSAYLLRRSLFMPWELPELLEPELVREGWARLHTLGQLGEISDRLTSPRLKVSALELCWYMRHQLLRDSDWAGMAHSLEIRTPLADVDLLRRIAPLMASQVPPSKRDMALSPAVRLPDAVLDRPKTGFTVPVRDWLLQSFDPSSGQERGLRGWAREVYSRFPDPLTMHRLSMRSRRRTSARDKREPTADNPQRDGRHRATTAAANNGEPITGSPQVSGTHAADLRLLVLLSDAFGGFGGIAKFNRDFLTALCAHERVQSVTAIPRLMPGEPGPLPPKLHYMHEALGGKRRFLSAVAREAVELRRSRPTGSPLVIFCAHINLLPAAIAIRRAAGGTIHLIVHGIDAWEPTEDKLVNSCVGRVDGFIAVSSVTRHRFQRWARLRADQGIVLPNCVDLAAFHPAPKSRPLLERYGIKGEKTIMTLGRLASIERYKGFDEVIEVMPALAQQFAGTTYLICGDGPDRARLVARARERGCEVVDFPAGDRPAPRNPAAPSTASRVIFTGRVSEDEKADHFRLADAYVMPSSGEGFGIVYLEALACGIPVIGSKSDGSREALREGKLGMMVDPRHSDEIYSAIVRVLSGEGIHPARAELEYFSSERFDQRVHDIIDAIAPV